MTGRPADQPPALLDIEVLFSDPEFASASISPDGTRIAYLASHRGRRNVWVRGIDQTHDDAVPVTSDARRGITTYYWRREYHGCGATPPRDGGIDRRQAT